MLTNAGVIIKDVEPIPIPSWIHAGISRWTGSFVKLRVWQQTEYDKVVWIDADNVVMHNIEDLFALEEVSSPPDFNACTRREDRFSSGKNIIVRRM